MSARVLVLARDADLRAGMARLLRRPGIDVRTADSASPEPAPWDPAEVDGVLVDAGLLAPETAQQLTALRARHPGALVWVMAGRLHSPAIAVAQEQGALPLTADFDLGGLLDLLEGGSGTAGVREPRRPLAPVGHLGAAVPLPESA